MNRQSGKPTREATWSAKDEARLLATRVLSDFDGPHRGFERWRVGRSVGRTVYRQLGPEPSDVDPLIGMMDSKEDAARMVAAVNRDESERLRKALGRIHYVCVEMDAVEAATIAAEIAETALMTTKDSSGENDD